MVKISILIILFVSSLVHADFLGFGSGDNFQSQVPSLIEKIKKLEMKVGPTYEENYNKGVKALENRIEEEKLYCAGELADAQGKVLPSDKKQLCIRELKKHYIEAMDVVYEMKRKYLGMIYSVHLERIGEIHKKLKEDIEKNF